MAKAWQLPEDYEGTYRLEFADPSFAGLKVVCRRHTFHSVEVAAKLLDIDVEALSNATLNMEDFAAIQEALKEFASALVKWNLQVKDAEGNFYTPKTNYKALTKLDLVFMMQIFMVWMRIMVRLEFADLDTSAIPQEIEESNGE